jgi:RNA polymerase primary sigma factor
MRQLKISKQITNRESLSFNKYLTEVSNLGDTITPEEEIELTRKIKEGDIAARNKLCEANLRFVISVAKQYTGQSPLPDLVNEGNLGLIKAAERFDESRGFKFISYAVWWIRQSIMQYLAENGRQIRLPLNKIGMVNKIKQVKSELEQIYQREPTVDEISDYLMALEDEKGAKGDSKKYGEDKIKELIFSSSSVSSLDAPMTNDSDSGSMIDIIEGESEYDVKKLLTNKDLQIELKRVLSTLKPREQQVLTLYFGLFDTNAMSLEEIGEVFDLTRERVRQIKEQGIRRLKIRAHRTALKEYR